MQNKLPKNIQQQIKKGIKILRQGGVIAFPTDTVYGLGAGAYIESAVARIYDVKKRSRDVALPLLLSDVSQIHEVAREVRPYAWHLIKAFMPGALTIIVYRSKAVKDIVTSGGDSVAIRIPDHPVVKALIEGCGMPVVGTSANLSGHPTCSTVAEVRQDLGDTVDLIIDTVPPPQGIESTVVDVTQEVAIILREGAIKKADIAKIVEVA
jgi:L-threonylcarbamoyladenylate synthase